MKRVLQFAAPIVLVGLCLSPAKAGPLIYATTNTGSLIRFDGSTPGTTTAIGPITGLSGLDLLIGIDFRPANGQLYGVGSVTGTIYTVNIVTGAATAVTTLPSAPSGTAFGYDFNPTVDRLRITSNNQQNLRANVDTGTITVDTPLNYALGDANVGATPRIVGSAYTNSFAGAVTTTLYGIDSNLDLLVIQNPPNNGTLNTVGALGFNTSDQVGFDILAAGNLGFATFTSPVGGASQLFQINLTTGAASLVGTIGGGVTITGIALDQGPVVPEPSTALLSIGGLLSIVAFRARKSRLPRT